MAEVIYLLPPRKVWSIIQATDLVMCECGRRKRRRDQPRCVRCKGERNSRIRMMSVKADPPTLKIVEDK
jgi:hypothetical protein